MIINIWSTPRTGSNWYAAFVAEKYQTKIRINQILNYYHLINYYGDTDWIYEYDDGLSYPEYVYDSLKQSIKQIKIHGNRIRNPIDEEKYRIEIIEKHNHIKNPILFSNHVAPMSKNAYEYLFTKADKNIFLYRENFIDQMSSYALGYATKQWKPTSDKVYSDVDTDKEVLFHFYERILYWHSLDKTNCEVVRYEDLEFDSNETMPKKQNKVKAFDQLSNITQSFILDLEKEFRKNFSQS